MGSVPEPRRRQARHDRALSLRTPLLAHIKFGTPTNEYYELVRSKTQPGTPIDLIATVRPYDDPGVERVYYRFRKIHSTIVQKTHMVFDFDDAQLRRFQELFIDTEWCSRRIPWGMTEAERQSFAAFEQIPPRSRYQFCWTTRITPS